MRISNNFHCMFRIEFFDSNFYYFSWQLFIEIIVSLIFNTKYFLSFSVNQHKKNSIKMTYVKHFKHTLKMSYDDIYIRSPIFLWFFSFQRCRINQRRPLEEQKYIRQGSSSGSQQRIERSSHKIFGRIPDLQTNVPNHTHGDPFFCNKIVKYIYIY